MLFEFLFCFHQHTMFTAPTFQAPELARLVTSPSRHGSGSGGWEPTARWPAPPPGHPHRLMMQRDLPLLQTRPAGLREAQGLTLGPTVVSRSRAAQSLARGLAQKPVGSALRCGAADASAACCAHGRRCADNAWHTAPGSWPCQQTVKVPALACPLLHLCINVQISEN